MRKIFILLALLVLSDVALAGYNIGAVGRIWVQANGRAYVGLVPQPAGTCSFYLANFQFDATTPAGKNILSLILAAKTSGKNIDVWFGNSSTPGSDQTNGCSDSTMATLNDAGFPQ